MTVQTVSKIGERAALFLQDAFPGLHKDKKIAQRLDVSLGMAKMLRRGEGWTVARLDQMSAIFGDAFARFLLNERPAKPAVVPPHADTCLWATHEGSLLEAPFGHPEFVRRYTGLPETGADEAAYAMRTIGWIALTIRGDGLITVRYAERGIDRSAAQRARDWLLEHASRITGTRRIVDIGGSHVEAFHPRAESAAEAIEGAAHLARSSETPKWQVTRRRLDEVRDERQIMLLNAYHTVPKEPGRLAAAAQDLNLLPVSNILRVEGGDVMSLWVGHDLRIAASQRMGTNVMERSDIRYASMVRDRVKQATLEGPTFYHVICSIDGIPTEYDNVAVPDPANGNSRLVVTTSRVIRRPAA